MIKVKVELLGGIVKELEEKFHSPSKIRAILEVDVEEGITTRQLFVNLAERYKAIGKKIFDKEKRAFSQNVVVIFNDRIISSNALEIALRDGDKLLILPIYVGG